MAPRAVADKSQEICAEDSLNNATSPGRLTVEHEPSKLSPRHSGQQLSLLAGKSSAPLRSLTQTYQQCNVRTDLAMEGLKPGISELLMTCES